MTIVTIERALSLRPEHARAILFQGKNVENRTWLPNAKHWGSRIAVHSAGPDYAILGTVRIVGAIDADGRRYGPITATQARIALRSHWYGECDYGWLLADPIVLPVPIRPVKGRLQLWTLPAEITAALR